MGEFHGRFVWYELMTTDAAGATSFYGDVVGWTPEDTGMSGTTYTMLKAPDRPVAGLMALNDEMKAAGARPGWVGYIAVDDVDAAAEQVTAKGGTIHRAPGDIPNVGRFAVAADPYGAVFCLFRGSPDMPAPPPAPMGAPGHVGWHELMAGELEGAFAFYSGLFGWQKAEAMDMGPMGIYQLFTTGGADATGGMMTKPEQIPACFWLYYFAVEGTIEAAVERVKSGGGQVVNGPMEVPGGAWIIQALDPQGVLFAVVAPPPA